ncbi:MAG: hypothetical protein ACKPKO_57935, partial [Candidatus Fonsibacter sp.]
MKSVFVSLWKDYAAAPRNTIVGSKNWNDVFSPAAYETNGGVNTFNLDGEFEFHMQIGSKLYPEYPIR